MADTRSQQAWASWVDQCLDIIRSKRLERVLRPLVPTGSSVEALIHEREHTSWFQGLPSPDSFNNVPLDPHDQIPYILDHELQRLTLFSLNDYLGISTHPAVKAAAAAAAMQVGCGPRSSALVGGFTTEHRQLELELAALKGTEDALLFPTGYAANLAVMTVLAATSPSSSSSNNNATTTTTSSSRRVIGQQQQCSSSAASSSQQQQQQQQQHPQVIIYSDEFNHASIIDGARLAVRNGSTRTPNTATGSSSSSRSSAGAVQLLVYRHNDLLHLEQLLSRSPAAARKLVVTDSLFSMDGDFADLPALVRLKHKHGFMLAIDDAHGTLVCGHRGGGVAEMMGVTNQIDIHVGTLSKAVGCLGGFVACSRAVRQLLVNRGRSVIYSTSLPVMVVAAARAALRVARSESWRRQHVWSLTQYLSQELNIPAASPIIPLVVGSETAALALSNKLLQRGYHVPAIRPPTVPEGTCRLRVSLSGGHTRVQVEEFIRVLKECLADLPGVQLIELPHLDEKQRRYLQQRGQAQRGVMQHSKL